MPTVYYYEILLFFADLDFQGVDKLRVCLKTKLLLSICRDTASKFKILTSNCFAVSLLFRHSLRGLIIEFTQNNEIFFIGLSVLCGWKRFAPFSYLYTHSSNNSVKSQPQLASASARKISVVLMPQALFVT